MKLNPYFPSILHAYKLRLKARRKALNQLGRVMSKEKLFFYTLRDDPFDRKVTVQLFHIDNTEIRVLVTVRY